MNNNEFTEIGQVTKVTRNRFAPDDEGSIELNINGVIVNCFVSEWKNPFVENEQTRVKLVINDTNVEKVVVSEKRIIPKKDLGYYGYRITGEIVSLNENPQNTSSYLIVADCGLKINASINKRIKINIGDYIEIEGRLDAYKVD